jgi:hypothetical protein
MSYPDAATYREREKQSRESAADLSPRPERDACTALADGYANLAAILGRLGQDTTGTPEGGRRETSLSHPGPDHADGSRFGRVGRACRSDGLAPHGSPAAAIATNAGLPGEDHQNNRSSLIADQAPQDH